MTSRLGIGLVGLGRHGLRYARHLLEDVPEARLVAVCRRNRQEGADFGAQHGVRFFQEYRDLVADPQVDAVVVVTPPSVSRVICLEAARARKPLLIEKPLASTGADAREMVEAVESANVPLMTAHTLRFDSAVEVLRRDQGTVGTRRYLTVTSRTESHILGTRDPADYAGRGVVLEPGIHVLDMVRFLTGEEVQEVSCETECTTAGRAETRCLIRLRTTGGFPCILDISRVGGGRVGRADWVGASGQLWVDWVHHRISRLEAGGSVLQQDVEPRATVVDVLRAFIAALRSGRPMPITGRDGLRAVEIADACYESAATGRTVRLTHQD